MKTGKKTNKIIAFLLAAVSVVTASGCAGGKESTSAGDMPTLKYYAFASKSAIQDGEKDVVAKVREMVREKIGVDLDMEFIDTANYEQQMTVKLAAGEKIDLMFVSPWLNNYANLVSKNALRELDDLLPVYAKEYYESIPASWWDCTRINGKIYGAINQQIFARQSTLVFDEEIINQTGFDYQNVKKFEDLEPLYAKLKEMNINPLYNDYITNLTLNTFEQMWGFNSIGVENSPGDVKYDDETDIQVFNQYKSEEFKNLIALMRDWNLKGYIKKDKLSQTNDAKILVKANPCYKPGYMEIEEENQFGRDVVFTPMGEPYVSTSNVIATMIGVTKSCKTPEKAVEFINLVNTDKELHNLICYGIEGVNYDVIGENRIKTKENNTYSPGLDWAYGNQFNSFVQGDMPDDVWQQQHQFNLDAKESSILGFNFDVTNVQIEMANCNAVVTEYLKPLLYGFMDIETSYPEFIKKLDDAGAEKIIAEKQAQLDAYIAAKQ